MNTRYTLVSVFLSGVIAMQSALAGGTTGPCTPPEGKINISPSQKCNGRYTVAIGKELTLTAVSLKDKDCYCGRGVQDTINTTAGVRWSVGGGIGTLDGGTDDSPKKYIAPPTIHTSVAVRLQVNDEATAPETYDDGGFVEVSSLNLDIVKPNAGTQNNPVYSQCPSPIDIANGNTHYISGRYKIYDVTGYRSGCTVDFKDLYFNESGGRYNAGGNGCGLASPNVGSNSPSRNQLVGNNNTASNADVFAICSSSNWTPVASCTTTGTIDWSITADSLNYLDWGQFNFIFSIPNPGGIDQATTARSWNKAL